MSNNRLEFQGLAEFRQALRDLPRELGNEAAGIVTSAVEQAKSEIVAASPEVTGALKRGVRVSIEATSFGASAVLRSNARHAHLVEFGSQTRKSRSGTPSPLPPRPNFIPVVMRKRRSMYDALKGLLTRAGFQVSGDV